MPGCTVPRCSNSTQKGFKLFHFPSDRERCARWVKNCGREEGWEPTRHTCICEVHFEESQFESHRADGLRKLKPFAVPTLFSEATPTFYRRRKKSNSEHEETNRKPGIQKSSRQRKSDKNNTTTCLDVSPSVSKTREESQSASEENICFICNSKNQNIVPNNVCTETSKTHLKQKLVQLVSAEFDLLVQDIGTICVNCAQILNCIDYIENVYNTLSKGILNHMKKKFCMEPSEHVNLELFMKSLKNLTVLYPWRDVDESCLSQKQKENVLVTSEIQHSHQSDKSSEITDQGSEIENEDHNTEVQESISLENKVEDAVVRNFECEMCSYETKYKAFMIFHLRQHFQGHYSCDFCSTPVAYDPSQAKEMKTSDTSCKIKDSECESDKLSVIPPPRVSKPQMDFQQHNRDSLGKRNVMTNRKRKYVNTQGSPRNVKRTNISHK